MVMRRRWRDGGFVVPSACGRVLVYRACAQADVRVFLSRECADLRRETSWVHRALIPTSYVPCLWSSEAHRVRAHARASHRAWAWRAHRFSRSPRVEDPRPYHQRHPVELSAFGHARSRSAVPRGFECLVCYLFVFLLLLPSAHFGAPRLPCSILRVD